MQTKMFLLFKIIPRARFNHATGRFWPAGRMFDTPALDEVFLRLVIQAMISSAQVPSRTKDWEMDFHKCSERRVGRTNPIAHGYSNGRKILITCIAYAYWTTCLCAIFLTSNY